MNDGIKVWVAKELPRGDGFKFLQTDGLYNIDPNFKAPLDVKSSFRTALKESENG
jgi:hypothetical protein